jgi:hypothetical protein
MKKYLTIILLTTPLTTLAATAPKNFKELIYRFIDIIQVAIPVVAALALLFFFWGLANFIFHADNEDKRKEGRSVMIWGVVALFAMVSVWGIIAVLLRTFSF